MSAMGRGKGRGIPGFVIKAVLKPGFIIKAQPKPALKPAPKLVLKPVPKPVSPEWPPWLQLVAMEALWNKVERKMMQTQEEPIGARTRLFREFQHLLHPDKNSDCPEAASRVFQRFMDRRSSYLAVSVHPPAESVWLHLRSCTFHLPVGEIYYTQKSCASYFQDGRTLRELGEELRWGIKTLGQVALITVVEHNGRWFSVDNRRLLVFKTVCSPFTVIEVLVGRHDHRFTRKFTTTTNGESIKMRGKGCGTPVSEQSTCGESCVILVL